MQFMGPEPADLTDVHALNRAFLTVLRREPAIRERLPPDTLAMLTDARPEQRERIARSPFLIYSLRESDERCWQRVFDGDLADDLVDAMARPSPGETQLVCATLVFLLQFAKQNPYSLRVVSGASADWCRQLAECNLVDLFRFAAMKGQLLTIRCQNNPAFWRKLLVAGSSAEADVRVAARITALQTVLTRTERIREQRLPAAACSMPQPAMRVAESPAVSNRAKRRYNTPLNECPDNKKSQEDLSKRQPGAEGNRPQRRRR